MRRLNLSSSPKPKGLKMQQTIFKRSVPIFLYLTIIKNLVAAEQTDFVRQQNDFVSSKNKLIVISTLGNQDEDSFSRFNRSVSANGLKLELLRDSSKVISSYENGISTSDPEGEKRRQFDLLRNKVAEFKDEPDLVLLLVEGTNSIINGFEQQILNRFGEFTRSNGTRLMFSADVTCWPDVSLAKAYPAVAKVLQNETRGGHQVQQYLDSRSLIGFAPELWQFLDMARSFKEKPDDKTLAIERAKYDFQLYSTLVYLSQEHRKSLHIELDHRSNLFENLDTNHVLAGGNRTSLMPKVELEFISANSSGNGESESGVNLKNLLYGTRPLVVHASGPNARVSKTIRFARVSADLCGRRQEVASSARPTTIRKSADLLTILSEPQKLRPSLTISVARLTLRPIRNPTRIVKIELNSLGNYLGKAWTPGVGCRHCNASANLLTSIKTDEWPMILVAIFIEEPTPFMDNFFDNIKQLVYPKSRLHLFIHNPIEYHEKHVARFLSGESSKYASYELADSKAAKHQTNLSTEWQAREYAQDLCLRRNCDYLMSLDSVARLEEPDTLRLLIETNRKVVAPLLSRSMRLWSNFWGSITREGYYARSDDYVDLVSLGRQGVWNVPLLMNAYLIEGEFLRRHLEKRAPLSTRDVNQSRGAPESFSRRLVYFDPRYPEVKPALIFARNLRNLNVFQFVTNMHEFGHLADPTSYNISLKYPDFYQLELNKPDWEREYLHENFTSLFDERDFDESTYPDNRIRLEEPCRDVFWFPLVSNKFADQLIELMEEFGQWSAGKNHDPRIEGGYESVPTRDIHFRQVGLHEMWLFFLQMYVQPIQLKEYIGYEHDPPRADLAFVVRYHPSEQSSLRPHHDSATYTLNIALNTPGQDYEGGGCRFVRYNCSVTESRKGWALVHPGRLTHYHEGLPVTNGTRYILVTFIDP